MGKLRKGKQSNNQTSSQWHIWLVVSTPLKKYEIQLGWLFPIYGKINMFQTTNQKICHFPSNISAPGIVFSLRCRLTAFQAKRSVSLLKKTVKSWVPAVAVIFHGYNSVNNGCITHLWDLISKLREWNCTAKSPPSSEILRCTTVVFSRWCEIQEGDFTTKTWRRRQSRECKA